MIVQLLNKCYLPVKITNGSTVLTVTAYNNAAILYRNERGEDQYCAVHFLNKFYLDGDK